MEDPDDFEAGGGSVFVDRVSQAETLRRALTQHRGRIDGDIVDAATLRNVLVFYGEGGMGKTELSTQLGDWVSRRSVDSEHWGMAPETVVDVVARWDVHDSRGVADPHALLTELRSQLGRFRSPWPAFDLPFASYHAALKPGVELRLDTPHKGSETLSDLVGGLTGDALGIAGTAVTGGLSAVVGSAGRSIVSRVRAKSAASSAMRAFPKLEPLIRDCESMSTAIEESAALAGRIAFMLTNEISAMPPKKRPMIVVFIDHMERLQLPGERHLGEATVNRLISRLPYVLFVVTGRNSLDWHEQRPDLAASGSRRWPLLSTQTIGVDEPRQHAVGHLTHPDAASYLRASFDAAGVSVGARVVENLAKETDGWPLHLQMIVQVAIERYDGRRSLEIQDLGGPLPSLVDRLLSDLPHRVAEAFRTACLLPYFDPGFVAAAGEVSVGDVEQLLKRRIVRRNPGSTYGYRVHDTLRRLVREAASEAVGGWALADWERHARLALVEAQRRFEIACRSDDDVSAIQSLALGLNIATDHDLFDPWLVDAVRRSPTIQGIGTLIAADVEAIRNPDLSDILRFLQLRDRALLEDVTDELAAIAGRRTAIASYAGSWRGYDLRRLGRIEESLAQFGDLISSFGDRDSLYKAQVVTTLRLARRFEDAMSKLPTLPTTQQDAVRNLIQRSHGHLEGTIEAIERRISNSESRRFRIELSGDLILASHRIRGVTAEHSMEVYTAASNADHVYAMSCSMGVLAQIHLLDEQRFDECVSVLEDLNRRRREPYQALPHALALRAWATNDNGLARRSFEIAEQLSYRPSDWISTEVLLEELGLPLSPTGPAQWLESYDSVRGRWLDVFRFVVDLARARE